MIELRGITGETEKFFFAGEPWEIGLTPERGGGGALYSLWEDGREIGAARLRAVLDHRLEKNGGHIDLTLAERYRDAYTYQEAVNALGDRLAEWGVHRALATTEHRAAERALRGWAEAMESSMSLLWKQAPRRYLVNTGLSPVYWRDENFDFLKIKRISAGEVDLVLNKFLEEDLRKDYRPTYKFDVCLPGHLEPIGMTDLRVGMSFDLFYSGNIGYRIHEEFRGHGYAEAAARALLGLARRHGMEELIITCNPENIASAKTIERIGGVYRELVRTPKASEQYQMGDKVKRIYTLKL